MMKSAPLVSVIVPAFHARSTIERATRSLLAGGIAEDRLEILIESDDGSDYAAAASLSPAVRVAVSGQVASGVGSARNRALARARGEFLAFLDADDHAAPGWLAGMLSLAQAEGAAVSALVVEEDGAPIMTLWREQPRLGFAELSDTGASVRPMVARAICPPFAAALSQDILHTLCLMARLGGSLAISPLPWHLSLTTGSVTAAADFGTRVHLAYLDHIAALESDPALPPAMARAAADVFRAKIELNAAHLRDGGGRSYYRFIADRLADAASLAGENIPAGG